MGTTTALESVWPHRAGGWQRAELCAFFFLEGRHDDDGMLGYSGGSKAEG